MGQARRYRCASHGGRGERPPFLLCLHAVVGRLPLFCQPKLLHEVLTVPEQPFVIHCLALPVADGCHAQTERLACGRNGLAITHGHGLAESARHVASDGRPVPRTKANWVDAYLEVRRVYEERLQILNVLVDAVGLVAIGPSNNDVLSVRLTETIPLLVAEHVEVKDIERSQMSLDFWRLLLWCRRRCRSVLCADGCHERSCQQSDQAHTVQYGLRFHRTSLISAIPPHR